MRDLLTRYRFTVEEYHRIGEAGILPEDRRIELIAGRSSCASRSARATPAP